MESLRMHPIAMTLPRTSTRDFEFQGHHIPANTRCLIAISVTHHLTEFFPEPRRFDIERYAPPRMEHTQTHAYVPYGIGSHACLGASTADLLFLLVNRGSVSPSGGRDVASGSRPECNPESSHLSG